MIYFLVSEEHVPVPFQIGQEEGQGSKKMLLLPPSIESFPFQHAFILACLSPNKQSTDSGQGYGDLEQLVREC